jgi:mRNA-degrading endonuclease RelE of RelBE toxin-antitoxin system
MSYNIIAVPTFRKELKKLAKKYSSLKTDLAHLFEILEDNPIQGTPLGRNCYKIRLAIGSKRKGKSGGARIITHFVIVGGLRALRCLREPQTSESRRTADTGF